MIVFLLDRSGSMNEVLDDTIGGFNSFVRSQEPMGGTMSLYTFNDKCKCVYRDVPIESVEALSTNNYVPSGPTALYDAMGQVLKEYTGKNGTLVVLTDGQENSSTKYTKSHVKDLIEVSKLDVIYVGVDIDDAKDLGIRTTLAYDREDTQEMFRNVSESVTVSVERRSRSHPQDSVCSTEANDSKNLRCTSL